jgi:hypothetical protein
VDDRVRHVYRLLAGLPRCNAATLRSALPSDGVYFFFENGEQIELAGGAADRVVRVGTHRVDGRFPARIRQHYGNQGSLGGNKNGSVFRKHLGGALLRRGDPADSRLAQWIAQGGESYAEVEEAVSKELRGNFTFVWVQVPTKETRLALESGLIALLAQYPVGCPSPTWLGRFAYDPAISDSGLWNTQHLTSPVLTGDLLVELETLAVATMRRWS